MQNQTIVNLRFINLNQFKSILSIYFFTIGTGLLGFSVYLALETFGYSSNTITSWSGQSLFWSLIYFFVSLFLLFIPVEFLNPYQLLNKTFSELITNILFTISTSLFFLILIQIFLPQTSKVLIEVSDLFKAVSFAGFIVVPITLFLLNNLGTRIKFLSKISYSITLLIWIFGTLLFI
tara:strand:+ start:949 stop:1482 length:534 start_codon:yes stop_codon:yes gene_type:complete